MAQKITIFINYYFFVSLLMPSSSESSVDESALSESSHISESTSSTGIEIPVVIEDDNGESSSDSNVRTVEEKNPPDNMDKRDALLLSSVTLTKSLEDPLTFEKFVCRSLNNNILKKTIFSNVFHSGRTSNNYLWTYI